MSNWVSKNAYLPMNEIRYNGTIVANLLLPEGWTLNAICGMLANMQCESNVNPGIWQGLNSGNLSGGFGLVQWTPATKFIKWCHSTFGADADITSGDYQIARILWEVENGQQWGGSPTGMSFREFTQSTKTPYELAVEFLLAYERPLYQGPDVQAYRGGIGNDWWVYFGGTPPDPENPPDPPIQNPKINLVWYGNGKCSVSPEEPEIDDTVIIDCEPARGSITKSIIIERENGEFIEPKKITNNRYKYTQPDGLVNITVYFYQLPKPPIWLLAKAAERRY